MSLEKKDTKIYLAESHHAVLGAIADTRVLTNSQLASAIVVEWLEKQAHAASVVATAAERAGIVRSGTGKARG